MCFPVAALAMTATQTMMVGLTALTTVMSTVAGNQAADASNKATLANYNQQMAQMNLQQTQINQQASAEMSERAKRTQAELARVRVSAGEAGVGGASVDRVAGEVEMNYGQDMATLQNNTKNKIVQTQYQKTAMRNSAQSEINQAESSRPSWIGAGLQIGGSLMGQSMKSNPGFDPVGKLFGTA